MENKNVCNICPRKCKIDREAGQIGFCKASNNIVISHVQKHMWEEPCISGTKGSGTIFFAGCNLRCKFCQNYKISQSIEGQEYSVQELADLFLKLQSEDVHNINLVSPTIYVDKIKEAIIIAKKSGLIIPIVYNSGGYETIDMIKSLDGLIDVYLPDFKYFSNALAKKYSLANDYVENAKEVISDMKRQVGNPEFDENGIIKKGLIIRHLILPNNVLNSKMVLNYISKTLGNDTWVSLMSQYFPSHKALLDNKLNRKITRHELDEVYDYMQELGLVNGYVQDIEENEEKYVPDFK